VILFRGVRSWIGELAGGDPQQVLEIVARRCRHAGRLAGADPEAVWQWAFAELVSTGLFLLRLGHYEEARTFLAVAGKLAAATANGQPGRVRQAPGSGQVDGPAGHAMANKRPNGHLHGLPAPAMPPHVQKLSYGKLKIRLENTGRCIANNCHPAQG
jgi:hypothetical protein